MKKKLYLSYLGDMLQSDSFAPIFIPTLSRFEHFERCVNSLSKCTYADKTELIIGLDFPPSEKYVEGYNKIKEYIPNIKGFSKVTLIEHKHNIGGLNNWRFLSDYCKKKYSCYIGTEDDNEFSPCFLDYMNKAFLKYENDENVTSISGFSDDVCRCLFGFDTYFCYANSAWGVGFWSSKEMMIDDYLGSNDFFIDKFLNIKIACEFYRKFPARFGNLMLMLLRNESWEDVKRSTLNYLVGKYQLRPVISLCRNWGFDGSGIHCSNDVSYSQQYISSNKLFDSNKTPALPDSDICNQLYKHNGMPKSLVKRIYYKYLFIKYYIFFLFKYRR